MSLATSALLMGDDWSEDSDADADFVDAAPGSDGEAASGEDDDAQAGSGKGSLGKEESNGVQKQLAQKKYFGTYALHDACEAGDAAEVARLTEALIAAAKADAAFNPNAILSEIDMPDDDGSTPLHCAMFSRNLDCVRLCLAAGADVNLGCEGSPIAHLAICVGATSGAGTFFSRRTAHRYRCWCKSISS